MAWYPVHKELILIGSNQPINLEFQSIEQRLQNPVTNKIMRDINFGTPYSFLGSIWFLKKELTKLGSGQHMISDNNPSLEFFLNDPRNISEDGINKIIESRSSVEDVWGKITQSSYFLAKAQKVTFKKHWDSRLNNEYADKSFAYGVSSADLDGASAHYRKAISHNASHVKALNNLAIILLNEQKTEEAVSLFRKVIKLKPDFVIAHNNLGSALHSIGKIREAISHYRTSIKLNPNYAEAQASLGRALMKTGNAREAMSHYRISIKLKPEHARTYYNLGNALLSIKKTAEAITHYKMAIKLNPDSFEAYNNLGNALVTEGKNEEAISHFKMAIKLKPNSAAAHNNLKLAISKLEKQ
jgi:tetratricopeptide (TPR) repeat protein